MTIIETKQLKGTEEARELTTHAPSTTNIYAYDNVGVDDKDVTSVRLGTKRDDSSHPYIKPYNFKALAVKNDGYDVSTYQARILIDSFSIDNYEKAKLHISLDEVQWDKKSVFRQATRRYVDLSKKSKIEEYRESITNYSLIEARVELEERAMIARDPSISRKLSTRPTMR
ncbi:hypothetical protein EAF00_002901 [Botryotinia globosa]|nr:hypothetical protein EAF00_002901 [Botryotinia globosa]